MAAPIKTGGPVETLEEAVHLLRAAPAGAIAAYLAGAVPFLIGLLFYWTEMISSRNAESDAFFEAFGLAVLFLWMNCCKAVFAGHLRRGLDGTPEPPWTWRRVWGNLAVQSSVQPLKLILMPLALAATLPAASACAFFRNVTALADGGEAPGGVVKEARRLASLWRRENWLALAILSAFSLIVFLNVAVTLVLLPQLVRILTGYETEFSRSGVHFALNWTFVAVAVGLTWLCVDPILQALYVVRCFIGQSVSTGADLRAELRALASAALLVVLLAVPIKAGAAPPPPPPTAASLDRSIDQVLARSEYRWRLPRSAPERRGFGSAILNFIDRLNDYLRRALRFLDLWIERFVRWLRDLFKTPAAGDRSRAGPSGLLRVSLLLLAALAAGAAVALFLRSRGRRARAPAAALPSAVVDLNDQALLASQLPEETWLALAEEWIGKQDLRMALRALYLGTLAFLGRAGLIAIHACKSNREYENELRRKSRAAPAIPPLFRENLRSFERSWYGRHAVEDVDVGQFRANLDRIKLLAAAAGGAS